MRKRRRFPSMCRLDSVILESIEKKKDARFEFHDLNRLSVFTLLGRLVGVNEKRAPF